MVTNKSIMRISKNEIKDTIKIENIYGVTKSKEESVREVIIAINKPD